MVPLVRFFYFLYKKDQSDYKPMRCGAYGPMRCIWSDVVLLCTNKISRLTNRSDAVHMVRCGAYGPMRCIWSDAIDYNPIRCGACDAMRCGACDAMRRAAYGPMRRGAYGPMLFLFVQKRSVGLQTDAMRCIWSDAMRCIWSDAMRCIWSDAVLVCTKKISLITNRCDAVHMVRCDAYGPMLFFFVQTRSVG